MTTKKIILLLCFESTLLCAQNKISNQSGNWSNPASWTPNGVPTATNNVTISNGNTITMDINGACNTLTVGTGGSAAALRFTGNTALTLSVAATLSVSTNGIIRTRTSSNATHSLNLKGDLINNGSLDLVRDANSLINLVFSKNGNQTFSGTGSTANLNSIYVNMGTSLNNILEVTCSVFSAPADFLKLSNGTFKFSSPGNLTLVPFTAIPNIPLTAGLWVNSSNAIISSSIGINLSGKITVSAGRFIIGNAANEDLSVTGGSVVVSSGTLAIAGKYNATGTASTFSLSGGSLIVPNVSSSNTGIAPFSITAAGSQFHMTGGSLIIPQEGGSGTQNLGFTNTGSTGGTISGGTLQIGNSSSPANQIVCINSTYALPNLLVNNANVTAQIITNALNVNNNITIAAGTLNANNLDVTLGGNWNNSGTFIPGTSTVIFASALPQTIFKTGGETFNHLLFTGTGLKSFSSAITTSGNFSIATSASVDVTTFNHQLILKGIFFNNGLFNSRNGLVFLNGTTQQSFNGSSTTDFYNLTLNNTAGAILNTAENLFGTLTLSNGTFNTNAKAFTLVSTASMTARVAEITGTGDLIGNVTAQRYVPGGTTGWALVGTPISSALTLNAWDDDIFISCPTCPDGSAAGFLSVYTYNEPTPGVYDAASSYVAINTINDAITPGKGYWVYMGNSQFTTTPITLDVTGTIGKFNYTIPLIYTNNGSAANDGWNLITNPYPSAISWSLLRGATPNIDNAIYVYNADLNSGTGGYASYVNGVSSPAVASGGIDNNIPAWQGFYVHSTGATGLSAKESNKTASNPNFLAPANTTNDPVLRINLNGVNASQDETVLYFQQGAGDGFDLDYDAYKMRGQDPFAHSIALVEGSDDFQINGIAPISGNFTMALKALTGYSGTYTISINDFGSFPSGACISLYDKVTSSVTDLRTNSYAFYLADTTLTARFVLSITLNSLAVNSSSLAPTCELPDGGLFTIVGANAGPWNYYWRSNGVLVKTSLNKSTPDSLTNLTSGNFEVEINTVGMCDENKTSFNIDPQIMPLAQFSFEDSLYLEQSDSIQFLNTSTNAISSTWFFENSSTPVSGNSPVHHYSSPGIYSVNLLCISSTGCSSSITKTVSVFLEATGIQEEKENYHGLLVKTINEREYIFEQKFNAPENIKFQLYNLTGELIIDYETIYTDHVSVKADLKNNAPGIYFMKITCDTKQYSIKLIAR